MNFLDHCRPTVFIPAPASDTKTACFVPSFLSNYPPPYFHRPPPFHKSIANYGNEQSSQHNIISLLYIKHHSICINLQLLGPNDDDGIILMITTITVLVIANIGDDDDTFEY